MFGNKMIHFDQLLEMVLLHMMFQVVHDKTSEISILHRENRTSVIDSRLDKIEFETDFDVKLIVSTLGP